MRRLMLVSATLTGLFLTCAQAAVVTTTPVTPLTHDEAVALAIDYAHNQLKNAQHLSGGFIGHASGNGNIIPVCVLNAIKDSKTSKYHEEDYIVFIDKNLKTIEGSAVIPLDDKSLSKVNPDVLKMYKENCADGDDAIAVEGPKK
jgi:opacity protein-like surface antigen